MEFKGTVSDPSLSSADLCPRVVLGELVTYELHVLMTFPLTDEVLSILCN